MIVPMGRVGSIRLTGRQIQILNLDGESEQVRTITDSSLIIILSEVLPLMLLVMVTMVHLSTLLPLVQVPLVMRSILLVQVRLPFQVVQWAMVTGLYLLGSRLRILHPIMEMYYLIIMDDQ